TTGAPYRIHRHARVPAGGAPALHRRHGDDAAGVELRKGVDRHFGRLEGPFRGGGRCLPRTSRQAGRRAVRGRRTDVSGGPRPDQSPVPGLAARARLVRGDHRADDLQARVLNIRMRSEFIDANGIRFHCLTGGEGPIVLLLHGFPQFSHEYRYLIPALAKAGYRAVAPDMRGFGETTRPPRIEDYALQTLGDDVAALIEALGETKAHVLGHEWGGIVAAEAALSHPERVDRLVLVNGPPAITLGRA